jgi:hypothetical protein
MEIDNILDTPIERHAYLIMIVRFVDYSGNIVRYDELVKRSFKASEG